jgi:hypothetical protein
MLRRLARRGPIHAEASVFLLLLTSLALAGDFDSDDAGSNRLDMHSWFRQWDASWAEKPNEHWQIKLYQSFLPGSGDDDDPDEHSPEDWGERIPDAPTETEGPGADIDAAVLGEDEDKGDSDDTPEDSDPKIDEEHIRLDLEHPYDASTQTMILIGGLVGTEHWDDPVLERLRSLIEAGADRRTESLDAYTTWGKETYTGYRGSVEVGHTYDPEIDQHITVVKWTDPATGVTHDRTFHGSQGTGGGQ